MHAVALTTTETTASNRPAKPCRKWNLDCKLNRLGFFLLYSNFYLWNLYIQYELICDLYSISEHARHKTRNIKLRKV